MAYEKKTVQEYIAETDDKTVEGFNDNQEDRIASEFDSVASKLINKVGARTVLSGSPTALTTKVIDTDSLSADKAYLTSVTIYSSSNSTVSTTLGVLTILNGVLSFGVLSDSNSARLKLEVSGKNLNAITNYAYSLTLRGVLLEIY